MKEEEGAAPLRLDRMKEEGARRSRKRKCLVCCGICSAVTILVIIVLIVLGVTLLKAKSPKISVDDVKLQALNVSLNLLNPRVTVALTMRVSVKNPNRASFRYGNATSHIFYRGDEVGQALIPAGKIGARGSARFQTNVSIEALRLISNSQLLPDVVSSGSLNISTLTTVSGRVNVLNVLKRHATSTSSCDITISFSGRNVQDYRCTQKTKL